MIDVGVSLVQAVHKSGDGIRGGIFDKSTSIHSDVVKERPVAIISFKQTYVNLKWDHCYAPSRNIQIYTHFNFGYGRLVEIHSQR